MLVIIITIIIINITYHRDDFFFQLGLGLCSYNFKK